MILVAEVQCLQIPHLDFGKSTKIIINMDKRIAKTRKNVDIQVRGESKKRIQ